MLVGCNDNLTKENKKMAKQRRNNSAVSAITAVTDAIRLETRRIAGDPIDMNEYKTAIDNAMGVVEDSNLITSMENLDDSIELQHQIAEQEQAQEEETEEEEQEGETEQETAQEQAQEQEIDAVDADDDIPY